MSMLPSGFIRLFTPAEANDMLARIRPSVDEMLASRERILTLRPDLSDHLDEAVGNGFSPDTPELLQAFEGVKAAVERIQKQGVLVKDVNSGLLDFPSEREGRLVFLCWQHGEKTVEHWHDLDAGFDGRQPL